MHYILVIGLFFAFLEWYGEWRENRILIYIFKPLVMVCIIGWMSSQINFGNISVDAGKFPILFFFIGMVFCLFGDVFLMVSEKLFIPGLLSFLFGHIFFLMGFGQVLPKMEYILPGLIVLGIVIFISVQIFIEISKGLKSKSQTKMKIPVVVYSIAISIMLYAAFLTLMEREWDYKAALLVSFGALFFYISDVLNAWIRFVGSIKWGRVIVMITYHLAQFAIAIGAVLHYIYRADT